MQQPLYGTYKIQIENFTVPQPLKYNFGKQFMTNKIIHMTQKERLEQLTGQKMPEPTEQLYKKYQMPGTPFWIITNTETSERNIVMGKYKLNKEPFDTTIDIEQWLEENKWDILISINIAITTDILNNKNQN